MLTMLSPLSLGSNDRRGDEGLIPRNHADPVRKSGVFARWRRNSQRWTALCCRCGAVAARTQVGGLGDGSLLGDPPGTAGGCAVPGLGRHRCTLAAGFGPDSNTGPSAERSRFRAAQLVRKKISRLLAGGTSGGGFAKRSRLVASPVPDLVAQAEVGCGTRPWTWALWAGANRGGGACLCGVDVQALSAKTIVDWTGGSQLQERPYAQPSPCAGAIDRAFFRVKNTPLVRFRCLFSRDGVLDRPMGAGVVAVDPGRAGDGGVGYTPRYERGGGAIGSLG